MRNRMTPAYESFLQKQEAKAAIAALRERGGTDDKIFVLIKRAYGYDDSTVNELMGIQNPCETMAGKKDEGQKTTAGIRNASGNLRANIMHRLFRKSKRK